MRGERLTCGLLLRLGVLLTAVCVCVHVYLDAERRGAPAAPHLDLDLGRPAQSGQNRGQQSRTRPASEQDGTVKRRTSYVRTLKRENPGRRRRGAGDREDPKPVCCPPPRPHRKAPRWHIDLEPWASESHSLEDEAKRFLTYITTPQVPCASMAVGRAPQRGTEGPWAACLDPEYSLSHRIQSRRCRVYSFGLGEDDRSLERSLVRAGCDVHCFDPGLKQLHLQQADMWLHRLSVDWRDPNPAAAQRQYANTKKLATILNDFGHRQVDVLKADMESAEWKILENLVLEGVLDSVGQLLIELHLHWAGFEVGGDDPSVVRYWFSLLKELERANFHLFRYHSDPARPRVFLHKNILNASSAYTLSWVNTEWKH